jgi:diketogulonate reductase-like aldo/keto reductase
VMTKSISTRVELSHGGPIPIFGLGVYQTGAGESTSNAVAWALEAGYRHIDTAALYANEKDVGEAVRASGVAREEVFVTTKLWNSDHGYDAALRAFDRSLNALGFEYVDLYLIHWPVERLRRDSWRALEKILVDGRTKSIGVSNYTTTHLRELLGHCGTPPSVNQVEFSPFLYQRELLEFCRSKGIQLVAYSPLTKGLKLMDQRLVAMADKYSRSASQILIRWTLQHDAVVIPKSANRNRIVENAAVFDFELSAENMAELDAMNEDLHTSWDPTNAP